MPKTPLDYIGENLLVTTSGNWFEPAFVCTSPRARRGRQLFAIDWPYESNKVGIKWLKKISISDLDCEKIAHLNAERIPRL